MNIVPKLNRKDIVLASSSPRRFEILSKNLGLSFRVVVSEFAENLDKSLYTPSEYVMETCKMKALDVLSRTPEADIILAVDTVVVKDDKILEKPKDEENAVRMISSLVGVTHSVFSGCTLIISKPLSDNYQGNTIFPYVMTWHEKTDVLFGNVSQDDILYYVSLGESLDKAGGYGIQSLAASMVKEIRGDFYNVMGLPLYSTCQKLNEAYKMF